MTDTTDDTAPRRMRGSTPPTIEAEEIAPPRRGYAEVGVPTGVGAVPLVWDGMPTDFVLAQPIENNHSVIFEGSVVTYNVMPHPTVPGLFIGPDTTHEAEHVMDLYRLGMFAGTAPARDRQRKQNAIDTERGVYEGVDGGPPLVSLGALDGAQTLALLRAHRGIGTPEQMMAAERQAARTEEPARVQHRIWPGAQRPPA